MKQNVEQQRMLSEESRKAADMEPVYPKLTAITGRNAYTVMYAE